MSSSRGLPPSADAAATVGIDTEGSFFALCASICNREGEAAMQLDAPLKGRLRLCSEIRPTFHATEYKSYFGEVEGETQAGMLTAQLSFLTLAGADGVLPWWITEKMIWDRHGDGKALHAFLDILNRRFWELLFISKCLGSHPHYGLYKRQHIELLGSLSYAAVGIAQSAPDGRASNGADFLNRIQRYCWAAAVGTGGVLALGQLLSESCGHTVTFEEYLPVHLGVTDRARLCLGSGPKGRLVPIGSVVGSKAWVACGLEMTVQSIEPDSLDNYLPTKAGQSLIRLREMLEICYVQNMPPLTAYLQCLPNNKEASCLGRRHLRLGWGACLSGSRPVSQILKISQHAISHQRR